MPLSREECDPRSSTKEPHTGRWSLMRRRPAMSLRRPASIMVLVPIGVMARDGDGGAGVIRDGGVGVMARDGDGGAGEKLTSVYAGARTGAVGTDDAMAVGWLRRLGRLWFGPRFRTWTGRARPGLRQHLL